MPDTWSMIPLHPAVSFSNSGPGAPAVPPVSPTPVFSSHICPRLHSQPDQPHSCILSFFELRKLKFQNSYIILWQTKIQRLIHFQTKSTTALFWEGSTCFKAHWRSIFAPAKSKHDRSEKQQTNVIKSIIIYI